MHLPGPHADQLHAQARDIAQRLIAAADALPAGKPRALAAQLLADGPVHCEVSAAAGWDPHERLKLAGLVAAELALHNRPQPRRAPAPHRG